MTAEELIEDEERFVSYVYRDSKGFWTIGFGTLVDRKRGGGITVEEGRYLMANRIRPVYSALDARAPWWRGLTQARQAVLVSMGYQIGIDGLFKFKRTMAAMEAGDHEAAARGMLASKWAREDSPERAQRAAAVWRTGVWE